MVYIQIFLHNYQSIKQPMISKNTITIVLVLLQLFSLCQSECNSTLLQFFTSYSLGKQDQLNKTFTKIQQRLNTLNNVSYKANQSAEYQLYNIKQTYIYLDSQQRSYFVENSTHIAVSGGILEVLYSFDWVKKGGVQLSGKGIAKSLSDNVGFVKQIDLDSKYAFEELTDFENITFFKTRTNITRIEPPSIPSADFQILENMFNSIENVRTVRVQLEEEIDKIYSYLLNQSLYDEKRVIDQFFQYQWNGTNRISIQYEVLMNKLTLQKQGILALYKEKIVNDTEWSCQHDVPELIRNPKVYGSQQFITMDVFKNTIRYAIQNRVLNSALDRKWESRFFQFYAGDLYEVIPKLTELYSATEPVLGSCNTVKDNLKIIKGGDDSINVTMTCNCELGIGRQKIAAFNVNLTSEVQCIAKSKQLSFKVKAFSFSATFTDDPKFRIQNKDLATHMITHSLNRIKETQVFGSGWPLYTRDNPHVLVEDDYVMIYDSTYIGDQKTLKDQ